MDESINLDEIKDRMINPDDYEIIKFLGSGKYGKVFKVKQDLNFFALKQITDYEETIFKREVYILSQLDHPCVLGFRGFSLPNNGKDATIITQLLSNGDLKEAVLNKPPGWTTTKKMINIYGIAKGMEHCHSRDVLHRDLKPENILLDCRYEPHIADFGLAKITDITSKLFQSAFKGTPTFTAPEMLDEDTCNEKMDVYSYAIIVYFIFTGSTPLENETNINTFKNLVTSPKGLEMLDDKLPDEIPDLYQNLIATCWKRDLESRPTFSEIVQALSDPGNYLDGIDVDEFEEYKERVDNDICLNDELNASDLERLQADEEREREKEKNKKIESEYDYDEMEENKNNKKVTKDNNDDEYDYDEIEDNLKNKNAAIKNNDDEFDYDEIEDNLKNKNAAIKNNDDEFDYDEIEDNLKNKKVTRENNDDIDYDYEEAKDNNKNKKVTREDDDDEYNYEKIEDDNNKKATREDDDEIEENTNQKDSRYDDEINKENQQITKEIEDEEDKTEGKNKSQKDDAIESEDEEIEDKDKKPKAIRINDDEYEYEEGTNENKNNQQTARENEEEEETEETSKNKKDTTENEYEETEDYNKSQNVTRKNDDENEEETKESEEAEEYEDDEIKEVKKTEKDKENEENETKENEYEEVNLNEKEEEFDLKRESTEEPTLPKIRVKSISLNDNDETNENVEAIYNKEAEANENDEDIESKGDEETESKENDEIESKENDEDIEFKGDEETESKENDEDIEFKGDEETESKENDDIKENDETEAKINVENDEYNEIEKDDITETEVNRKYGSDENKVEEAIENEENETKENKFEEENEFNRESIKTPEIEAYESEEVSKNEEDKTNEIEYEEVKINSEPTENLEEPVIQSIREKTVSIIDDLDETKVNEKDEIDENKEIKITAQPMIQSQQIEVAPNFDIEDETINNYISSNNLSDLMQYLNSSCDYETTALVLEKYRREKPDQYRHLLQEGLSVNNAVSHYKYAALCIVEASKLKSRKDQLSQLKEAQDHLQVSINQNYTISYLLLAIIYYVFLNKETTAFNILKEGTKHNDKNCKCLLGYFIAHGIGTTKDFMKGVSIIIESNATPFYYRFSTDMGIYYSKLSDQQEEERNKTEAFHWFERAFNFKETKASINNYGVCFLIGFGVDKNIEKAKEIFNKGVEKDDPHSMYHIGFIYEDEDPSKSIQFYKKAADKNHTKAQAQYAYLISKENQEESVKYFTLAANKGDSESQANLANAVGEKDSLLSTKNFKKSAENGNVESREILAMKYSNENDAENVFKYMDSLIKSGNYQVPLDYARNLYNAKKYKQAFFYFSGLANYNNPIANYFVGVMKFYGHGCNRDKDEAYKILKKLSNNGVERATDFIEDNY